MKKMLQMLLHLLSIILAACSLLTACSSHTSIKYTESEVQLIPPISFPKAFTPGSRVLLKTKDLKVLMKVKGYEGIDYMIGLDENQKKEVKIAINEIIEIEKIFDEVKAEGEPSSVAEGVELATYLPLTPLIATRPIFYLAGLDMNVRDKEELKTRYIYRDITKEQLLAYIGEPKQKYLCGIEGIELKEIWVYSTEQVLPGGELMFFRSGEQTVNNNEGRFGGWKSFYHCPSITKNEDPRKNLKPNELYNLASYENNIKEVVHLLSLAAEKGHLDAQKKLGKIFEEGKGVSQNYNEAIKWYTMAAYQGDINAQKKLGQCYIEFDEDYTQAYAWLCIATEQGSNMAKKKRDKISKKMTPEEITAAEELIKEIKAR